MKKAQESLPNCDSLVSKGCSSTIRDKSGSLAVASRPTQAGPAFGTACSPILPWVGIPNLGSHILAIVRRRLPGDLIERCNITPVLIETFVETPDLYRCRLQGVGLDSCRENPGRGRYDRDRKFNKPRKDAKLQTIERNWQRALTR